MAWPIAGETPPGVHLLNSQGMGHLDLQSGIIWYSLLKVAGDVQTLVFLRRRFNLMRVTVLTRRVIGLIIRPTSSGNKCCCLVELRLVPRGLTGGLLWTGWGTCTFSIQPPVPGHIGLVFLDGLIHLLGCQVAIPFGHLRVQHMSDLFLYPVQRNLVLQGPKLTLRELVLPVLSQITHGGADPNQEVNGGLIRLLAKVLNCIPLLSKGEGTTVVFPQHLKEGR